MELTANGKTNPRNHDFNTTIWQVIEITGNHGTTEDREDILGDVMPELHLKQ